MHTHTNLKAILLMLALFLLTACGTLEVGVEPSSDPNAAAATVPVATATLTGQPDAMGEDGDPSQIRTEIPVVDAIIEGVTANDLWAVRGMVKFTTIGCTNADGLGGPPKCEEGENEGDLVEVLPILGAEGSYIRSRDISYLSWSGIKTLYAVYRVPAGTYASSYCPRSDYGIVFSETSGVPGPHQAVTFLADNEGIVCIIYGQSPESLLQQGMGEFVLPPLTTPEPTAPPSQ